MYMSEHLPGSRRSKITTTPSSSQEDLLRQYWASFPPYPTASFRATEDALSIAAEQTVLVNNADLQREIVEAEHLLAQEEHTSQFLDHIARFVADQFPGNVEKWHTEFVNTGVDADTTLADVKKAGAASCFHRAIALGTVLQRVGIDAKAAVGYVLESDRESPFHIPPGANLGPGAMGVYVLENESFEGHVFNIVRNADEVYLVDSAMLLVDEFGKGTDPLVEKVDVSAHVEKHDGVHQAVSMQLRSGRYRHYVFQRKGVTVEAVQT